MRYPSFQNDLSCHETKNILPDIGYNVMLRCHGANISILMLHGIRDGGQNEKWCTQFESLLDSV